MSNLDMPNKELVHNIIELIDKTRQQVAQSVNVQLTMMYWHIGKQINDDLLKNKRAEYGKRLIANLSKKLKERYGRGFSKRNIHNFIKFNELYSNEKIVHALSAQLSWTHIRTIYLRKRYWKRNCTMLYN